MTRRSQNSPNPHGSPPDRGVLDEALEPEQIRSLNSALRKLSETDAAGKDMQEAAKKLLSGRLALRDALDNPAVARALSGGGMASLRGQWESLSEEEREQIRSGEAPASDDPSEASPRATEPGRAGDRSSRQENKVKGRHNGGFPLY
ncbi:hypothetical protein SUDANB58_04359 [Streptomyces sp. enrichment culture]|uniref:hypothetical protein n=1 Tax=Streptomyces sp. enrichment culture TaxID=1795815 RepID=UPI003F54D4F3